MRILLTTDPIGGVWTFTKELAIELLGSGHAVALVSFGRELSREQSRWCAALAASHPSAFLWRASTAPLEWMTNNRHAYTEGEQVLLRVAREFAPDVLHAGQFCFGRVPLNIPILITAHSDVLSWAQACRPGGLAPSPWLDHYQSLARQGLDCADAVVAPTHWMLSALAENFRLPKCRSVIPNGLNFAAAGVGVNERSLQAVTCGRLWDEAKGLALLARVAAPFPIFVAGEERLEDASMPKQLGQASPVGALTERELARLMSASGVYLATSIYEPFGLAPLEAALCGCAVVARDIASLREVWGDAALYFSSASGLTRLLARLSAEPAFLYAARRSSRRRALGFSSSRMAEGYLSIYKQLVAGRDSGRLEALSPELASYAS